jgi:hypothetical protein
MRQVFAIALFIAFAPPVLLAQSGRPYSPPRTPDGHPDLQGLWDVSTITPVERPQGLPAVLTAEQARQQENQESNRVANAARPSNPDRSAPPAGANVGTHESNYALEGILRGARLLENEDAGPRR